MRLGEIQKQWIADLRQYPERQSTDTLGRKCDNTIQLCCLGQGLVTLKRFEGIDILENDCRVKDGENTFYLVESYKKLGLHSERGDFKSSLSKIHTINGQIYTSLSDANDNRISWSDLADFIESNPSVVFNQSL